MRENWRKRSQTAQGMVEFALILPVLLLLILGIFAFGHFFYVYAATVSASREAARYGSAVGPSGTGSLKQFEDCNAIKAAARRVASIAGTTTINIDYDNGPGKSVIANCDSDEIDMEVGFELERVGLGDRITVEVVTKYEPIVPLINIPPFDIKSHSSRTILRAAPVGTAAVALPPGSPIKIDTTLEITSDEPDHSHYDEWVRVMFHLDYTGGTGPTGNVTIIGSDSFTGDGNEDITCTVALADGYCDMKPDAPGNWTFTATYEGDGNYNPSQDTEDHQVFYETGLTIESGKNPSVAGEEVKFTITFSTTPIDPSPYSPTGTIDITDSTVVDGTPVCTVALPGGECYLTFNTSEDRTLTATYISDGYFETATASVDQVVNANYESTTTITGHLPEPSAVGQKVTVSYAIDIPVGASAVPSGNVTVTDGLNSCTGTVSAGNCPIELTLAGIRQLTAMYSGDGNYNNSTSPAVSHTVSKATPVLGVSTLPDKTSGTGQMVKFNFTVTPTTGSARPTGSVQVSENGSLLCQGSIDISSGAGSCEYKFTTEGTKTITVTYIGDVNFNSVSTTLAHTVVPCPILDTASVEFIDQGTGSEKDWKNQFIINLTNSTLTAYNIQEVQVTWPSVIQTAYIQEFHYGPVGGNATDWACAPYKQGNQTLLPPNCLWAGGAIPSVYSSAAPGQACEGKVAGAACFTWKNAQETLADTSLAASTSKGMYFILSIPAASVKGYKVNVRLNSDTCKWISADFSR